MALSSQWDFGIPSAPLEIPKCRVLVLPCFCSSDPLWNSHLLYQPNQSLLCQNTCLELSPTTDCTETSRSVMNRKTERNFFTPLIPWSMAVCYGQSWPLLCSKHHLAESPLKEEIIHPISSHNQSITSSCSPGTGELVFIAHQLTEELVWAALGKRGCGKAQWRAKSQGDCHTLLHIIWDISPCNLLLYQ